MGVFAGVLTVVAVGECVEEDLGVLVEGIAVEVDGMLVELGVGVCAGVALRSQAESNNATRIMHTRCEYRIIASLR
jgi:hypothetical protein